MADEPLPGDYPLTLVRGDSREWTVTFTEDDGTTAKDMSGYTWLAQVRETFDATTAPLAFTVDTTNAATGSLKLTLAAADWADAAATVPTEKWRWDLQGTTAGGFVRTFLAGKVKVLGDVSRSA